MCVLKDYSCIQNSIPFTVAAGKEETSLSNTQYLSKIQKCIQLYSKAAAFLYFPLSYSYALWHILPKYWWVSQTLHFPLLPPRLSSAPRFLTLSIHSHFVKPTVVCITKTWLTWGPCGQNEKNHRGSPPKIFELHDVRGRSTTWMYWHYYWCICCIRSHMVCWECLECQL